MATELVSRNLHDVIDIVDTMCNMQVNGIDSAIPFLRGEPGGGKTESIRHMAAKNGDEFYSLHFALKQPEDLGGIPQFTTITLDKKEILSTKWSIPEVLEHLILMSKEARKKKKKVIFFLDDIHRCGPFHVTALFELLSERKIREIRLPDNVAIVLAGNGSIKAGAQLTNSAIINRCSVMDVRTDFDYWKDHYALTHDFNIHILSFLRNERYRHWFHAEEDVNNPWPSPRSWSKLSNLLNVFLNGKKKLSLDKLEFITQAHVGRDATKDFITYYQIIAKFKVDEIFHKVSEDIKDKPTNETIENAIKMIQQYDELHQFALSQAMLIEYTQKTEKERKEKKYTDAMCALMLAFIQNPHNTFPEMSLSMIKELFTYILKKESEKEEIRKSYDAMAQAVGSKSIHEIIDDLISQK